MIVAKLQDASLSRQEFDLLPYIDRRLYEETAFNRFSSLDNHLDPDHADFALRLHINDGLAAAASCYIEDQKGFLCSLDKIEIIDLGSSLGAISSLFVIDSLYKAGFCGKAHLTMFDLYAGALERTKALDFDLMSIHSRAGFAIPIGDLKAHLIEAKVIVGKLSDTQIGSNSYAMAISGFAHHHLNYFDKEAASQEMVRITADGGGMVLGDLSFSYERYVPWLQQHKSEYNSRGEVVPYAVESFIRLEQHMGFFAGAKSLFCQEYEKHYIISLRKGEDDVQR